MSSNWDGQGNLRHLAASAQAAQLADGERNPFVVYSAAEKVSKLLAELRELDEKAGAEPVHDAVQSLLCGVAARGPVRDALQAFVVDGCKAVLAARRAELVARIHAEVAKATR